MAEKKRAAQIPEDTAPLVPEEGGDIGLNENDPWLETVKMIVPKKPKGDDPQYYICVNDRRYLVPADGKVQELPLPIAEALQKSLDDEDAADEYAASIPNMTGEVR
jgi:hypothetical protein